MWPSACDCCESSATSTPDPEFAPDTRRARNAASGGLRRKARRRGTESDARSSGRAGKLHLDVPAIIRTAKDAIAIAKTLCSLPRARAMDSSILRQSEKRWRRGHWTERRRLIWLDSAGNDFRFRPADYFVTALEAREPPPYLRPCETVYGRYRAKIRQNVPQTAVAQSDRRAADGQTEASVFLRVVGVGDSPRRESAEHVGKMKGVTAESFLVTNSCFNADPIRCLTV